MDLWITNKNNQNYFEKTHLYCKKKSAFDALRWLPLENPLFLSLSKRISRPFAPKILSCVFSKKKSSFQKKSLRSSVLLSNASNACCSLLFLFFFSHIYIYIIPQDLNFFPKRKILLFPFFFFSFFKSSNQKQSSQFQIPLQDLPRRVPPSLNSNGKFPCKKTWNSWS